MEAQWMADRAALRALLREHPAWSHPQLARTIGRSVSWIKKWRTRLRAAPPDDPTVLWSRSCARHTPPVKTDPPPVSWTPGLCCLCCWTTLRFVCSRADISQC